VKQSQFAAEEGGHRPPCETLSEANLAKQSQSEGVSDFKCEVSSSTPAPGGDPSRGRLGHRVADPACETKPMEVDVSSEVDSAKQSQFAVEEGGHSPPCETDSVKQSQSGGVASLKFEGSSSTPAPGGDPSRGRLGHMVVDPACETKPIGAGGPVCSVPVTVNHGRDAHATETPCGVTTNEADSAKQSQFAAEEGGHSPPCETDCAKPSQCPGPGAGARAVLRARPRVAWHCHNT
jgi:hypothetical protein